MVVLCLGGLCGECPPEERSLPEDGPRFRNLVPETGQCLVPEACACMSQTKRYTFALCQLVGVLRILLKHALHSLLHWLPACLCAYDAACACSAGKQLAVPYTGLAMGIQITPWYLTPLSRHSRTHTQGHRPMRSPQTSTASTGCQPILRITLNYQIWPHPNAESLDSCLGM